MICARAAEAWRYAAWRVLAEIEASLTLLIARLSARVQKKRVQSSDRGYDARVHPSAEYTTLDLSPLLGRLGQVGGFESYPQRRHPGPVGVSGRPTDSGDESPKVR